jgi:ABC-type long-subunit fatty acid transport system fused permease/ATPase subunit
LANTWFGANERVTALTIAVASQALGAAVGFTLPTFFISNDDLEAAFKVNIVTGL